MRMWNYSYSRKKKRIVYIMTAQVARKLNPGRRFLLLVAGTLAVALPLAIGTLHDPAIHAQTPAPPVGATHAHGDIAADWQGTMDVGKLLHFVFRIAKTEKG